MTRFPDSCSRGLMPSRIEDYAVIGNCETLALVGRDGSIDWLCLPRFDSRSLLCRAARRTEARTMADRAGGRGRQRRRGAIAATRSILETVFRTANGAAQPDRLHGATRGSLRPRAPRPRSSGRCRHAHGARRALRLRLDRPLGFAPGGRAAPVHRRSRSAAAGHERHQRAAKTFAPWRSSLSRAGQEVELRPELVAVVPLRRPRPCRRPTRCGKSTSPSGRTGRRRTSHADDYADAALRSLLTLKALAHWETGGIVAAGTTSLPEKLGGSRNWDYRYCWLRDATFTLLALIGAGFLDEARAWHEWLLRAVAGSPDDVQTIYGVAGERRLDEYEISWLPGYRGRKARAHRQRRGRDSSSSTSTAKCSTPSMWRGAPASLRTMESWALERALVSHLETIWREPDEGIWEVRGGRDISPIRK